MGHFIHAQLDSSGRPRAAWGSPGQCRTAQGSSGTAQAFFVRNYLTTALALGYFCLLHNMYMYNAHTSRFRPIEVVSREVTRLIRSDPVPFHTIPEAAQLLPRRDNLQQGAGPVATELYHLLYWRNVSPASTILFFYRPFSLHPITAQFANKAMQSFKPVSNRL